MTNQFWEFERVIKYDVHGQPYEARVVKDKRKDYGKLWEQFKRSQAEAEAQKEYRVRQAPDLDKVNRYEESKLL